MILRSAEDGGQNLRMLLVGTADHDTNGVVGLLREEVMLVQVKRGNAVIAIGEVIVKVNDRGQNHTIEDERDAEEKYNPQPDACPPTHATGGDDGCHNRSCIGCL